MKTSVGGDLGRPSPQARLPHSGGPTEVGPYGGLTGSLQIHARKMSGALYSSTRSHISRGAPQMGHM